MHKIQFQRTLLKISGLFIQSSNFHFNEAINDALALAGRILNIDRGFLFLLTEDGNRLKNTHEWVRIPEFHASSMIFKEYLEFSDYPFWNTFFQNPRLLVLNSLEEMPAYAIQEKKELLRNGVQSNITAPVFKDNKAVGCVGFESIDSQLRWSEYEISFVEDLAQLISAFITRTKGSGYSQPVLSGKDSGNVKAEQNIHNKTLSTHLQFLSEAAVTLSGLDTREQILEYTAEILYKLTGNNLVIISEYIQDEKKLIVRHLLGMSEIMGKVSRILGFNPIGKAFHFDDSQNEYFIIESMVLHKLQGGLTEASFGTISKTKDRIVRSIAGVREIYGCGFHAKGKVYGTCGIFIRDNTDLNPKLIESFLRMVSIALFREDTYYELLKSKKEKQEILDKMSEGVISIDKLGNIIYVNKAATDMSGYTKNEITGQNIYLIIPDQENLDILNDKVFQNQTDETHPFVIQISDKQGIRKWIYIKGNKLYNPKGELSGYLGVVSDITLTREKEAALREYELGQRTTELKQQFLSNMSHEMLTPINGIYGVADMLLSKNLPGEEHELVAIISQSTDQLLKIVRSIWDTLGLKEGVQKLNKREFWLCDLLYHNINLFTASARDKEINLKLECNQTRNLFLNADELKINQVLTNLLGNAIKFQRKGGEICFRASFRIDNMSFHRLRFDVIDNGPGIPPDKQSVIFTLFGQVDPSASREKDGLGLGLNIAKELVELMQGEIGFESNETKGSHFWFEIPVIKLEENVEAPACICTNTELFSGHLN